MAERWVGRVALVTGASVGIGAAIARKLAGYGMKVVGCANNGYDKVKAISEDLKTNNCPGLLYAIKCDITKESEIQAMFAEIKEKFGGVDVCVNNAGLSLLSPLLSGETEKWRHMVEVNVIGLAVCTREAIKSMDERGIDDGHIFHISSLSGHKIIEFVGFYSGTKHMVKVMTEVLRLELRERKSNIRVTSISPGHVDTDFLSKMLGSEIGQQITGHRQSLKPDDIADNLVHALHSPPHCQIHDIIIRPTQQPE